MRYHNDLDCNATDVTPIHHQNWEAHHIPLRVTNRLCCVALRVKPRGVSLSIGGGVGIGFGCVKDHVYLDDLRSERLLFFLKR